MRNMRVMPHGEHHVDVQVLGAFRHPNLLPLLAFSAEDDICLVYPLMVGGSLHDRYPHDFWGVVWSILA